MPSRTASCCCGQLSIEIEGEPRGVGVCHCFACQRRTGSVFAALAGFARTVQGDRRRRRSTSAPGDQGARFPLPVLSGLRYRACSTPRKASEGGVSVSAAVGAFAAPEFPAAARLGLRQPPPPLGPAAAWDQNLRHRPGLRARVCVRRVEHRRGRIEGVPSPSWGRRWPANARSDEGSRSDRRLASRHGSGRLTTKNTRSTKRALCWKGIVLVRVFRVVRGSFSSAAPANRLLTAAF